MRHWLITCTTYGSWLPGDPRGSVTSVRDYRPSDSPTRTCVEHDQPGAPWEPPIPELERSAQTLLKSAPIFFTLTHAKTLLAQFQETSRYRNWDLLAVAIMVNHFHLVVAVEGDPDPEKILIDYKAYGSRALNERFGRPESETWWTTRGSKRKLRTRRAIRAAINYVLHKQSNPLVTWSPETGTRFCTQSTSSGR